MSSNLVSVIVPVYKVEQYLNRCVSSIIRQSYANLEIILVDDGSPDRCPQLCDEWALQDSRIKVIHKENGGLSDARNAGIKKACGKYICFVDSDDYISSKFVETLYELIHMYNTDISAVSLKEVSSINQENVVSSHAENIVFEGEAALKELFSNDTFANYAWNKMYKRDLFEDVKFPVGRKMEDLGTTYKLLLKAERIAYSTEVLYYYPDKFKIRKFGVSDVIAITAAGKTAFYYVDKEALVKFNGFLAPKAEGSYLILNEDGYQIEGQTDTWKVIDEKNVQEQRFVQLVCEQTKKQKPDIVLHDSGVLVAQTIYGFDSSVMKKIEKFLREQKPELLHHQKFLENGTAERAKESGTEQNYNMIDGCVNNNPKKPRIIGNRISVLDRLHIKLEERKQKSQPQQQQQQERSRKN